jgi:hypothetical protein
VNDLMARSLACDFVFQHRAHFRRFVQRGLVLDDRVHHRVQQGIDAVPFDLFLPKLSQVLPYAVLLGMIAQRLRKPRVVAFQVNAEFGLLPDQVRALV